MSKIIDNWKGSAKLKKVFIIIGVFITLVIGAVSYFYYGYYQDQEKIKSAKSLKIKQENNSKKSISDFYIKAFDGSSIDNFLILLKEINISRVRLEQSGFSEYYYQCDTLVCGFNYKLKPGALFNVQDKIMRRLKYKAAFSDDELSYAEIPSDLNNNFLKERFINESDISPPACSNVLNYLYSYNSSRSNEDERIVIKSLPATSVASQEDSFPGYKHSYGFMVSEVTLSYSDNSILMKAFFDRKPYRNYFLITGFNKSQDGNNIISLNGKFICKK